MKRPVALSPEDLANVELCLQLLQQAQSLVDSAAQALCPVPGFGNQWSALGTHRCPPRAAHQSSNGTLTPDLRLAGGTRKLRPSHQPFTGAF
jgi:hypothetical protein